MNLATRIIEAVKEDKLYWGFIILKVGLGIFVAFQIKYLDQELNRMGCRYAIRFLGFKEGS